MTRRSPDAESAATAPSLTSEPILAESSTAPTTVGAPGLTLAGVLLSTMLARAAAAGAMNAYTGRPTPITTGESVSTAPQPVNSELLEAVTLLFEQGAGEFFIDGMQSRFSTQLLDLVARHKTEALRAISDVFAQGVGNDDVAAEALRWLTTPDDEASLPRRWLLLENALRHRSPKIRDGAILGFARLDDPKAAPLLRAARTREHVQELARLIDRALLQIES